MDPYEAAFKAQAKVAKINAEGTQCCLETFNEDPCSETAETLSESLGYSLAQPAYLLRGLTFANVFMGIA